MTAQPAKVTRLPVDAKDRRARQLQAKWAEEDRLWQALVALRRDIRPLQREVSLAEGFLFTVSREKLARSLARKRP
jgi:hypothetical protein